MATEENKNVARRLYETINEAVRSGDMTLLGKVVAPNMTDHNPVPGQATGLDGVKQAFSMLRSAFPDLALTVEDMIAEGDLVASRITSRGTHKGTFAGIPATGKQAVQGGMFTLRRSGLYKIKEGITTIEEVVRETVL